MKNALTPLFSTLILLLFAIGLGIFIISWGTMHEKMCPIISFTSLDGEAQACYAENMVKAVIENNAAIDADSIQVSLVTSTSSENLILEGIPAGEYSHVNIPVKGEILKIRLIPIANDALCTGNRIELENIGDCYG